MIVRAYRVKRAGADRLAAWSNAALPLADGRMHRHTLTWLALLGWGAACNSLLGNQRGYLVQDRSSGEAGASTAGGEAGASITGGEGGDAAGAGGQAGAGANQSGAGGGGVECDRDAGATGGCPAPSCQTCALPRANAVCVSDRCEIASCQDGFRDANGLHEDGCERGDIAENGLTLWLMADRGVSATGAQVYEWVDQSANRFVASQANLPASPKRVETTSGLAMLEFDGVDDHLQLLSGFSSFNGTAFFAVVEAFLNEGCAGILHFSNGDDGDDVEFGRHTPNLLYYEVVGEFLEGTRDGFASGRRLLVSIVQDLAGVTELRINTAIDAKGTVNLPANVVRNRNFVGKDDYDECPTSFHGRIGEIVFYSRFVDALEEQRVEHYLLSKWSIEPDP